MEEEIGSEGKNEEVMGCPFPSQVSSMIKIEMSTLESKKKGLWENMAWSHRLLEWVI